MKKAISTEKKTNFRLWNWYRPDCGNYFPIKNGNVCSTHLYFILHFQRTQIDFFMIHSDIFSFWVRFLVPKKSTFNFELRKRQSINAIREKSEISDNMSSHPNGICIVFAYNRQIFQTPFVVHTLRTNPKCILHRSTKSNF